MLSVIRHIIFATLLSSVCVHGLQFQPGGGPKGKGQNKGKTLQLLAREAKAKSAAASAGDPANPIGIEEHLKAIVEKLTEDRESFLNQAEAIEREKNHYLPAADRATLYDTINNRMCGQVICDEDLAKVMRISSVEKAANKKKMGPGWKMGNGTDVEHVTVSDQPWRVNGGTPTYLHYTRRPDSTKVDRVYRAANGQYLGKCINRDQNCEVLQPPTLTNRVIREIEQAASQVTSAARTAKREYEKMERKEVEARAKAQELADKIDHGRQCVQVAQRNPVPEALPAVCQCLVKTTGEQGAARFTDPQMQPLREAHPGNGADNFDVVWKALCPVLARNVEFERNPSSCVLRPEPGFPDGSSDSSAVSTTTGGDDSGEDNDDGGAVSGLTKTLFGLHI